MSNQSIKFFFFIVAVLIIGFFFSSELIPIKNFFYKIIAPPAKSINGAVGNVGSFFSDLGSIKNLVKENNRLNQENLELKAQISDLKELEHENSILRQELGFSQGQKNFQLIPADVIGQSPTGFLQTIKIDHGSNDGIKVGQAVISNGFLVGIVEDLGPNYSDISLINNNRSIVPVVLQQSRGTGLLTGGLAGLTVTDIPLDINIIKNEVVVTSGLGNEINSGIPVGYIEKTISSASDIFQKATITSPINFSKLEFVFIVK